LLWFLEQRGAFWFDAEETEPTPGQPSKSAVIIPFRAGAAQRHDRHQGFSR
jgi:hypothetical protein